jgi:predicted nucleic acid-binding protein
MKIYLDNCCFNRPFDDQTLLSTRLETEAKLKIQEKIKAAEIALGWSYILDFENNANPFLERHIEIQRWKKLADSFTNETPEILTQMKQLMSFGLKPIDALHVACAIELKCDYFLTVDKGILKKAANISSISVTSPINLIIDWGI